jgi:hypothetical protein
MASGEAMNYARKNNRIRLNFSLKETAMYVLKDSSEILHKINEIGVKKIAVAYIGDGFDTLIPNIQGIQAIVISTGLGSNPYAIAKLVKMLTWDRVFFLQQLHSKIYLGKDRAVVASSNLSRQGLVEGGNEEFGVVIDDRTNLDIISKTIDRYIERAQQECASSSEKEEVLQAMRRAYELRASSERYISAITNQEIGIPSKLFAEYDKSIDGRFWVSWVAKNDNKYDIDIEKAKEQTGDSRDSEFFDGHTIDFPVKDTSTNGYSSIKPGDYVLFWIKNQSGSCSMKERPFWFFVDAIITDACTVHNDNEEWKCSLLYRRTEPSPGLFEIDDIFWKNVLPEVLEDIKFRALYDWKNDPDEDWYFKHTNELLDTFIEALQESYRTYRS